MKTLPEKLRELMYLRNTNPTRLAKEGAGVGQNTIHRWMKGERRPKAGQLKGVARLLGVTVAYLVDDAMERPEEAVAAPALTPEDRRCLDLCRRLGVERAATALEMVGNLPWDLAVARLMGVAAPGEPGRAK